MKWYTVLAWSLVFFAAACTPKADKVTGSKDKEEPIVQKPEEPKEKLSPCPKFSDAPDPDQAETDYVLYRDQMRLGNWNEAYKLWQKVYTVAPAADGRRNTVLSDGVLFFEIFAQNETDEATKKAHIDRIFRLYDQIQECYPEGGYIKGIKAFDYYYKYPERSTPEQTYQLFKASMDEDGEEAHDFILNPFTALLADLHKEGKIPDEEARDYASRIQKRLQAGLADCEGEACERWKVIEAYVPARLEYFETVKGFYDCSYYQDKYFPEFEANPTDCDVIRIAYSRLIWGGCDENDAMIQRIRQAANEHCVEERSLTQAYAALREARYKQAIDLFEKAANEEKDNLKKSNILLTISKIYYAHLKNFPASRKYALDASKARPNWGEPFLLIGRLYASSGPLCGPGRGWDSQVVVWPAIDMWNRAKSVDPTAAKEANEYINRYLQYMPSGEDLHQRILKEGDTFRVGCWIQENTVVRAAPRN